ncbi:peptidase inhibitor family I36 protein [Streptomyces sp. NBC_01218]|uniref:peptidase inhibitor family I36 protein n=1 Tax=unclassified Streptomyces TaxID=2593676 RepID=UPI0023B8B1FE|nr:MULTISPECIES: peptidase inhibitor family I36 protein [unclassified Streptomyces]WEH42047.1 peptidase inhibitor family I36 protein [Streptomyces sp. AM 2-1-1]WSQ53647.1 peptidase inhibitor family I36 protein [Streptomyces sp. NBC_01218]
MRKTVIAAVLAATALVPAASAVAPAATPAAPGGIRTTVTTTGAPARAPGVRLGECAAGALCLWKKPDFTGARQIRDLSGVDVESCVPLPAGSDAQAFANRTGRNVTLYQSAECGETGEFETYPGAGTWVPRSPYQVRAFKMWEN